MKVRALRILTKVRIEIKLPEVFPIVGCSRIPLPISKEIVTVSPQFLQLLLRIKRYNEEKVKKLFEKNILFF